MYIFSFFGSVAGLGASKMQEELKQRGKSDVKPAVLPTVSNAPVLSQNRTISGTNYHFHASFSIEKETYLKITDMFKLVVFTESKNPLPKKKEQKKAGSKDILYILTNFPSRF